MSNNSVTHLIIGGDGKATSAARHYADLLKAFYEITFIEFEGDGDYPAYVAERVALATLANPGSRGIIFCVTGLGTSDAASKVPGITCVGPLLHKDHARRAATSKNANVITMAIEGDGQEIPIQDNLERIRIFLDNVPNWDPESHSAKNMAANLALDKKYRRI